jgi:N-acetylmuramoyl-L-alanine amidase
MWWWMLLSCADPVPTARAVGPQRSYAPVAAPEAVWPDQNSSTYLVNRPGPGASPVRLYLDAGHGAPGNLGATSAACEREADATRRLADALVGRISTGVDVRRSRPDADLVAYRDRVTDAAAWGADAFVSLHFDARAGGELTEDPRTGCWRADGDAGFAVLWSDEGSGARVEGRRRLAHAVAARLVEAGFLPYGGRTYVGLYEGDVDHPGVFVDRHEHRRRIYVLRGTPMASVIVETHNGFDVAEGERWEEPRTVDAFAAALRAGVLDAQEP